MNSGYGDNQSNRSYAQFLKEGRVVAKAMPVEKDYLNRLYKAATYIAGKDHSEFSSRKTTDKGIMVAAGLMSIYRKLLADIRHRENLNDS